MFHKNMTPIIKPIGHKAISVRYVKDLL
jgi:hypothetical protein